MVTKKNPFEPEKNPFEIAQEKQGIYTGAGGALFSGSPNTPVAETSTPQIPVPISGFYPSAEGGGLKVVQGAGGKVFAETLTHSQAATQGISENISFSKEQQAIMQQNALNEIIQQQKKLEPTDQNKGNTLQGNINPNEPSSLSREILGMNPVEVARGTINAVSTPQAIISSAAQVYDLFKSSLSASKSTDVKKAEASFIDATNILQQNVALVKTGQKSYIDAERDMKLAESSINDLERTTRGLGRLNLRYWLDNGREIEAQILREKTTLQNIRIELELAREQARQIEAQRILATTGGSLVPQ